MHTVVLTKPNLMVSWVRRLGIWVKHVIFNQSPSFSERVWIPWGCAPPLYGICSSHSFISHPFIWSTSAFYCRQTICSAPQLVGPSRALRGCSSSFTSTTVSSRVWVWVSLQNPLSYTHSCGRLFVMNYVYEWGNLWESRWWLLSLAVWGYGVLLGCLMFNETWEDSSKYIVA